MQKKCHSKIKDIITKAMLYCISIETKAMHCIYTEPAKQKQIEYGMHLEKIKSMTFDPEELTYSDVAHHKRNLHPAPFIGTVKKDPITKRQAHRSSEAASCNSGFFSFKFSAVLPSGLNPEKEFELKAFFLVFSKITSIFYATV